MTLTITAAAVKKPEPFAKLRGHENRPKLKTIGDSALLDWYAKLRKMHRTNCTLAMSLVSGQYGRILAADIAKLDLKRVHRPTGKGQKPSIVAVERKAQLVAALLSLEGYETFVENNDVLFSTEVKNAA